MGKGIAIGSGAAGRYPDLPVSYLVDLEEDPATTA